MKKTNKILSIFLSLCMLSGTCAGLSFGASATESEVYHQTTANGVIRIATAEQLLNFAEQVNLGKSHLNAELVSDIDMSGVNWNPIGNPDSQSIAIDGYLGTFDGKGYAIKNLTYNGDAMCAGLFGSIGTEAIVQNVGLQGGSIVVVNIQDDAFAGGVCGYNNGGIISNCYNTCNVSATSGGYRKTYVSGGICGENEGGLITNCYNSGNISGIALDGESGGIAGGVCGEHHHKYDDKANIVATKLVSNCYNTGSVTAGRAGGVCGSASAEITECYNLGFINATSEAGGICAARTTITNCYNEGDINVTSGHAGGICTAGDTITNCCNKGNVNADCGTAMGIGDALLIENCTNLGNIKTTANGERYAGAYGICCDVDEEAKVIGCCNKGAVSAGSESGCDAGGICHNNYGIIENCYNIGSVNATGEKATAVGVCCYNDGYESQDDDVVNRPALIENCYNAGDISANGNQPSRAAGLCISNGGEHIRSFEEDAGSSSIIENCYNSGNIKATGENAEIAGLCLFNAGDDDNAYYYGTIKNCYWENNKSHQGNLRTSGVIINTTSFSKAENGECIIDGVGIKLVDQLNSNRTNHADWEQWITGTDKYPCFAEKQIKVKPGSSYVVNNTNGYVSHISEKTTKADFLNNFSNSNIEVYNANGEVLSDSDNVGTGCVVKLTSNGSVVYTATVVVTGDVDGNGEIDIFDVFGILDHINNKTVLTGAKEKATLVDSEDEASIFDVFAVLDYINGKRTIEPKAV